MKRTESGNSYWDNTGAYQELWDQDNAVPVLNCLKSLYYEYYNNGNCNVLEEFYEGYSKTITIESYYRECLETIEREVESACDTVQFIIEIMLDEMRNEQHVYDELADHVLYHVSKQ